MCYQDYLKNLENFNYQLNVSSEEKENLKEQLNTFIIEKRAKLKFLATSLISCTNLFKKIENQNKKQAFIKWQYNVSIRKIAETAFTRVLELNHRHSKARFKAAGYILKSLIKSISIQNAFDSILKTAHMKRMNHRGTRFGYTKDDEDYRLRSKNCKDFSDQNVLNNVSCLLSPINMKNIEKKNLYQKQINSFYTPINNDERVFRNNSAIINPKQINYIGEQGLNLIQLKPEEVIKDLNTSLKYQTYASTTSITNQSKNLNLQKSNINPSKVNLKKAINKNDQNISRYSNNSVLPLSNQKRQKNCNLKIKQQRNNDFSRDYQTEYINNPMEDLDKNLSLSQIEFTAKHKRDYSPIITTSKYDLQQIYDPLGNNKKRENRYSSVNNSHDNYSKNKIIKNHNYTTNKTVNHDKPDQNLELQLQNAQYTKHELKKKLESKQQQLEELRKQLQFGSLENKINKQQQRSTSAQQRIKQATNEYSDQLLNQNVFGNNYSRKQTEFSPPERLQKKSNERNNENVKSKAIQNVQSALFQRYKEFKY